MHASTSTRPLTTEQVYHALADAEHAAWLAIADARPGMQGFDQAAWDAWSNALHAVCNASPRTRERFEREEGPARAVPDERYPQASARADGRGPGWEQPA